MEQYKKNELIDKAKKQLNDRAACDALHKNGKLSAHELMNAFFDEGSFVETSAYVKNLADELGSEAGTSYEGVITGYGAVDGRLVFAYSQDVSRLNGAFSAAAAAKIESLYALARKNGAPVVSLFDSNGAKVLDGISVLGAYGRIMRSAAAVKGVLPQIAVVLGKAVGASSVIASMADIVIVTEGSTLSVSPVNVLIDAGADKSVADAKNVYEAGEAAVYAANPKEAAAKAREILSYLPANRADHSVVGGIEDDPGRAVPELEPIVSREDYDAHELLAALSDGGKYTELFGGRCGSMITALAFIGGMPVGVIANDPSHKGGRLCAAAFDKAEKLASLCAAFGVSIVDLVGTSGFSVECEAKGKAMYGKAARFALTLSGCRAPVVTLYIGKAYGTAFTLLGSKALGADMVFALPTASIGVLSPSAGTAMLLSDRLSGAKNPKEKRARLEEDYELYECTPLLAASVGEIDDIIAPVEARARIASALEMLSMKTQFETL